MLSAHGEGVSATPTPPGQTDACENIAVPQTSLAGSNKNSDWNSSSLIWKITIWFYVIFTFLVKKRKLPKNVPCTWTCILQSLFWVVIRLWSHNDLYYVPFENTYYYRQQGKVMFSRVPTRTGKPGKVGRHFPVREQSGNFEQTGKVRENYTKYRKTERISEKNYLLFFNDIQMNCVLFAKMDKVFS